MINIKEKKIAYFGLMLIAVGLLCNIWIISAIFSRDEITSVYSKLGIWIIQFLFVSVGLCVFLFRKQILLFNEKSRANPNYRTFVTILVLLTVVTSYAIPELLLRFLKPQQTYSQLLKLVKTSIYAPSEFNLFELKANTQIKTPSMEYPGKNVEVRINSLGLRGEEITLEKPSGVKRILVLGDSYTYGVYVGNDETYPAVLEELFERDGRNIQVINAGYADGWSPDEHYAWLINRAPISMNHIKM